MANKRFQKKPKIQQKNHEWLYGINAVEAAVSSSYRKHFACLLYTSDAADE